MHVIIKGVHHLQSVIRVFTTCVYIKGVRLPLVSILKVYIYHLCLY